MVEVNCVIKEVLFPDKLQLKEGCFVSIRGSWGCWMGSTSRSLWRFYQHLVPAQACSKKLNVGTGLLDSLLVWMFSQICSMSDYAVFFLQLFSGFMTLIAMGRLHLMTFWASCEIWRVHLWQSNRDRLFLGPSCVITRRSRKGLDPYSKIINNPDWISICCLICHMFSHAAFSRWLGHNLWVCPYEL